VPQIKLQQVHREFVVAEEEVERHTSRQRDPKKATEEDRALELADQLSRERNTGVYLCGCVLFVFERIAVEEMPLVRYEVRCEHSLADPELYRKAFVGGGDDSSRALLEGVAMAGLVGIIRQLGDLAEYVFVYFSSSSFSLQHCFVAFFLCLYTEEEAASQFLFVCFWVGFFSGPYFELHFPVFIFSYSSQNS
jgi:hypothetical protein